MRILLATLLLISLQLLALAVKRHDFKTCSQSGFCNRQRTYARFLREHPDQVLARDRAKIDWESLKIDKDLGKIEWTIVSTLPDESVAKFGGFLQFYSNKSVQIYIGHRDRFDGSPDLFVQQEPAPPKDGITLVTRGTNGNLEVNNGPVTAVVRSTPEFVISLYDTGSKIPFLVFNERQLLRLESKFDNYSQPPEGVDQESERYVFEYKDSGAESFAGKTDSKPKGPESIGLDLFFPNSGHVYGLPEHSSPLSLPDTFSVYNEPYRLYNLDVFEFELNNPMALYGSVPYLVALERGTGKATSVLWLNAAEMWVDVDKSRSNAKPNNGIHTHWFAETGVLNLFIFRGENPLDVSRQFTSLVGKQQLPPIFALGNHQCRWNYVDELDCLTVNKEFDQNDLPYDVLWLDIEHTDGKRYFTWAPAHFPNPEQMQKQLALTKRKLVTIVDPHIKADANFHVSKAVSAASGWITDASGKNFEGWCWPGNSQWPDFYRDDVRQLWASLFNFDKYKGSTLDNFIWNDMNEPSVFTGPEITMPKDCLHARGALEHRSLHNMYGLLVQNATYHGLLDRQTPFVKSELEKTRPFILSRAFYTGTQKFGAIWTGDNTASWEQLQATIPMLLTISLAGISFAGADVGGFFNNPDEELILRWYQTAVFQPFLRNHAHIDTKRREPFLLSTPSRDIVRSALKLRYKMLPMWYTWFYRAATLGDPVMQPLSFQYPRIDSLAAIDTSFCLGDGAVLVAPVLSQGLASLVVSLPDSANNLFYEYDTGCVIKGESVTVQTPLHKIPLFIRGGSVITLRERPRRSASLMLNDPYTVHVYLDTAGRAKGELFIDDGLSFKYQDGSFILVKWSFDLNAAASTARFVGQTVHYSKNVKSSRIERLVIHGLPATLSKVSGKFHGTLYSVGASPFIAKKQIKESKLLIVKNPDWVVGSDNKWSLEFYY